MLQVRKIELANCWSWIVRALEGLDAEIDQPNPVLAQKCFREIAVELGIMISIAAPEIVSWPLPIVLSVRVVSVATPKNGNI